MILSPLFLQHQILSRKLLSYSYRQKCGLARRGQVAHAATQMWEKDPVASHTDLQADARGWVWLTGSDISAEVGSAL